MKGLLVLGMCMMNGVSFVGDKTDPTDPIVGESLLEGTHTGTGTCSGDMIVAEEYVKAPEITEKFGVDGESVWEW